MAECLMVILTNWSLGHEIRIPVLTNRTIGGDFESRPFGGLIPCPLPPAFTGTVVIERYHKGLAERARLIEKLVGYVATAATHDGDLVRRFELVVAEGVNWRLDRHNLGGIHGIPHRKPRACFVPQTWAERRVVTGIAKRRSFDFPLHRAVKKNQARVRTVIIRVDQSAFMQGIDQIRIKPPGIHKVVVSNRPIGFACHGVLRGQFLE